MLLPSQGQDGNGCRKQEASLALHLLIDQPNVLRHPLDLPAGWWKSMHIAMLCKGVHSHCAFINPCNSQSCLAFDSVISPNPTKANANVGAFEIRCQLLVDVLQGQS